MYEILDGLGPDVIGVRVRGTLPAGDDEQLAPWAKGAATRPGRRRVLVGTRGFPGWDSVRAHGRRTWTLELPERRRGAMILRLACRQKRRRSDRAPWRVPGLAGRAHLCADLCLHPLTSRRIEFGRGSQ